MIDQQLGKELRAQIPKTTPDFARQRRELLQSIQLTLVERAAGKSMEDELSKMFQEASTQLRVPAGVAAPRGGCTALTPMRSPAVAGLTGLLRAASPVLGASLSLRPTPRTPPRYP